MTTQHNTASITLIGTGFKINPTGQCVPQLTSACTRLPTARFFNGSALTTTLFIEGSLAGPAAGDARR